MFECNGEGGFLGVLCDARGVCVFFVHVGKKFVRQVRSGAGRRMGLPWYISHISQHLLLLSLPSQINWKNVALCIEFFHLITSSPLCCIFHSNG
jgi:hypothetical protein